MELYLSSICCPQIPYLQAPDSACASCSPRFREPPFWRHERFNLQPQEEMLHCIESTAGVAEPDENLELWGEGDEDEEGGRAEERTHEHDGWTLEEALIADIDLL